MKTIWIILLSACVGGLLSTMLTKSCQVEPPLPEMMVLRDTTTDVYIDTHTVYKPVPYKVVVRDTVVVNSFQFGKDWKVLVQEVKEYQDSTYYARVSGINAFLEEIRVYPKETVKYITNTEIVREKPPKWTFGLQGGYGITPKGLQPYIGVGVTYKLTF